MADREGHVVTVTTCVAPLAVMQKRGGSYSKESNSTRRLGNSPTPHIVATAVCVIVKSSSSSSSSNSGALRVGKSKVPVGTRVVVRGPFGLGNSVLAIQHARQRALLVVVTYASRHSLECAPYGCNGR